MFLPIKWAGGQKRHPIEFRMPKKSKNREVYKLKEGIHPNYKESRVACACGESFITRSIKDEIHVDICSKCHPFFTGTQKIIDTEGRVAKFKRKYAKKQVNNDKEVISN